MAADITGACFGDPLGLSVLTSLVIPAGTAAATSTLRLLVEQRGDFVLLGNTLAHDCAPGALAPIVGNLGPCGNNTNDSAPSQSGESRIHTHFRGVGGDLGTRKRAIL